MSQPIYKASWARDLIAGATFLAGLLTLATTLDALVHVHRTHLVLGDAHLTVIAGLSLVYLATLLKRGKYNAWLVSLGVYTYLVMRNLWHFDVKEDASHRPLVAAFNTALPALVLVLLIIYRNRFKVRSELASFGQAAKRALLVLLVAFLYGLIGFQFLDNRDFHQEISWSTSVHYTVDQFGLTTHDRPIAYTRRAVVFVDSLGAISVASLLYVAIALFSPIRFRLRHDDEAIEAARQILRSHSTTSEDFFKLWPRDKAYFFNADRTACIAYRTVRGVALAVGDPVGPANQIEALINNFMDYCYVNGWSPAFIHAETKHSELYLRLGYDIQKIGEEPLLDIRKFMEKTVKDKYFRHISSKFTKAGFSIETLKPPYDERLLARLQAISDDWLAVPGRAERGFMLGYFTPDYVQLCDIICARDVAGEIQAFINRVPSPKPDEDTFDFLRSAKGSPGNINDYLMIGFINELNKQSVATLNMGLSPLSGLNTTAKSSSAVIDNLLRLVYSAAGRFYSFQGLRRFKSKYEPQWEPRYIVYLGGVAGFGKTMNALLRAMNI